MASSMGTRSCLACAPRGPRSSSLDLLLLQSTAGYFGILAYLETVRRFGSKVTTIVTSCRKLFTIALSSVLFGHPLNGYHAAGVLCVFLGVEPADLRARADLVVHHIMGNRARLSPVGEIHRDTGWREALSEADRATCARLGGDLAAAYGYV